MDESKWNKMLKLNRDFNMFKQNENEKADKYLTRFSTLETKLSNENVKMNTMFLASHLLNQSTFSQQEKENII